jgi:hypothetical protein
MLLTKAKKATKNVVKKAGQLTPGKNSVVVKF